MPACKNCQSAFTIYPEDRAFYGRIGVPEPTFCPLCRNQRRLAWRNERTFYQGKSDLSGKTILSVYSPDKKFPVYEQAEWWGDAWDPFSYGREIDWQRPMMEQIHDLFLAMPRPALFNRNCVNSHYGNLQESDLNCYYEVGSGWCEESHYGTVNIHCSNILDSHYAHKCELSYYLINCENCYNGVYCQNCHDCLETYFCYNCRGCSNCFGCVNLRNAKYHWFNEPISEADFKNRLQELGKYSFYQKAKDDFFDFKKKNIQAHAIQVKCENSTGDYLTYCHDVKNCSDLKEATNCKYFYRGEKVTDSYDCDNSGWPASWLYEVLSADTSAHCMFNIFSWENSFIQYCFQCFTSQDLFACSGLRGQKFCILNKQYSEEEYKKLLPKVIAKMKADGEYGEFFPVAMSPYAYNETVAQEYYPLTRKEVLAKGWRWQDNLPGTFGKETVQWENIPDDIKDAPAGLAKEILACQNCQKNYKLIPQEISFYQKQNLPLPRLCPLCRHLERIKLRNPRRLYHRQCMRPGCANEFETTYAPDRPEKVYCEECYRKEIY
ncbi:MAG: hypothetical protein WCT37_00525 [Patescibacteria group bacterium]|jgi:hypothetical protein